VATGGSWRNHISWLAKGGQGPAARDVDGFFFRRLRSEDKAPSGGCSSKATDRCASGL